MKLLTFAFVIAFILQDHGTFQVSLIDSLPPAEQLRLFKKYVYEFVDATCKRLRENESIMEGGSECIRLIKRDDTSPVDAVLAIMSIANDYYEQFAAVGKSDTSPTQIDVGLMKNIRDVLFIVQRSVEKYPAIFARDYLDALKAFTLQLHKPDQPESAAAASAYDESIESAEKCYRSLISIDYTDNEKFFDELTVGFQVASRLLLYDDEEHAKFRARLRHKLNTTTGKLSTLSLKTFDHKVFAQWLKE